MEVDQLNENFSVPGVFRFEERAGLAVGLVTSTAAEATVYLHGAHITHWQPAGHEPVLFLSERSEFAPGKPIRGGIPICFPWFGPRRDGKPGPSHGFARIQPWDLSFAAMAGETLHLTFTLGANEASRALGFDNFHVAYHLAIGRTLVAQLSVANTGAEPLAFEEALHTYFAVQDVRKVSVAGLEGAEFVDKTDGGARGVGPATPLRFTGQTDRIYPGTKTSCVLDDPASARRIAIEKSGSATTVVWNPWVEVAARLPDMGPEGWCEMICVETANAGVDRITLAPGATHSMQATFRVTPEVG